MSGLHINIKIKGIPYKLYMDDKDAFLKKWGNYIKRMFGGRSEEFIVTGSQAREFLGRVGRQRALQYEWSRVSSEWVSLINKTLEYNPEDTKGIIEEKDVTVEMI